MKAKPKKIATYPNNTFRHFVSSTGRRLGTESKTFCTLASYGGRDRNHKDIPLSIVWICCLTVLFSLISVPTFALEYSSSAGVNFTISPSISVSVSGDLIIDELAPGSSNDSNVINVTVLSNNSTGYTLSSTTGSSTNNYTDLKLDGNSSDNTNKFTNLNTNKASLSNFDDNSWGYSYSIDSGTNWVSGNTGSTSAGYNGLPLYTSTGIKLVDTTAIGTNTIQFKIGAKASNTQAAGEYTNIVNFAAVGKAAPVSFYDAFKEAASQPGSNITMLNGYYKMQDMSTTICNNVYTSQLTDNSDTMEAQLIDVRDNNVYWVAKLKDGKCWMTQNLDLNLDKDVALTSNDTDLVEYGINGYVDGYSCSNDEVDCDGGVISWIPERSTINAVTDEIAKITWLASWGGSPIHPYSVDSGNWYWVGTDYNSKLCWPGGDAIACSYMWKKDNVYANYFSNRSYTGVDTSKNGEHGSVGNYYNWSASIASNDSSVYIDSTYSSISNNPENSVCPLGWRLSRIASYESGVIGSNEIYNLVYYYGGSGANLIVAPLYLVRSGAVWGSSGNGYLASAGYTGRFWTSTVSSDTKSYIYDLIDEVDGGLNVAAKYNRLDAVSVRCLAR